MVKIPNKDDSKKKEERGNKRGERERCENGAKAPFLYFKHCPSHVGA